MWCCSSLAIIPPAITYWLDPWADAGDKGYQLSQSLITIGSGGLWGLGLGKSRQKFLFLPEEHNDFIFAIVCEELGLIGACVIMLLFAALVLRGYWIALHTRDRFGALLVVGIITLIAMQAFLNIAVVTGTAADHRYSAAVFQLRRHGTVYSTGGNGNCTSAFPDR